MRGTETTNRPTGYGPSRCSSLGPPPRRVGSSAPHQADIQPHLPPSPPLTLWVQPDLSQPAAASHFGATHVLALRGGALVAPALPGWRYAPVSGAAILRQMIRMRVIAVREAGHEESAAALLEHGLAEGLMLAGYAVSAAMIAGLQNAAATDESAVIAQADIGGAGLWLRAEPDEDQTQAEALSGIVAAGLQC